MSGGRSVGVWNPPFLGCDKDIHLELTEQDKLVLCRLQRGERGNGLDLERIHGANPHVLTVRPDKKRRLFLWVEHNKIIVIHIMENHKHHRVPGNIMNFIFDGDFNHESIVNLTYEPAGDIQNFTPDPNFELKEIKSAACYNQHLIIYDENQADILEEKLPVLLHGDFGSGKSALARSLLVKMIVALKDVFPDKDFVYYSHLPDLVRHMFDMFLLDNPDIATIIDLNRIKFLDTLGLIREYGPIELANKQPVGLAEFKEYILNQYQNERSSLPFIDIHSDMEVLYDEFQIIASLNDDQAYLSLGDQATNYAEPALRSWLLKVAQGYCQRMHANNEFDLCTTTWQPKVAPLAFLVGDEIQGAPLSVIKMIPSLVYGKQNIMLCGDSNQSERRLSVLPRLKAMFNDGGAGLTVRLMPGSYRSPLHMIPLLNAVIRIKQSINHGLNDKHQASSVQSKAPDKRKSHGGIEWVNFSDHALLKAKLDQHGTVYVIITHEAYINDAKKYFGKHFPIYTPRQARGMEFPVVVFYRLFDEPLPAKNKQAKSRLLSERLNPFMADVHKKVEPAKHQPKKGQANPIYEPKLNDWVIALSRLVGSQAHCFMVEVANPKKAGHLQAFIKDAIKAGQAWIEQGDNSLMVGTTADWETLALKNIEAGNHEQALVAYERLGKTAQDLEADVNAYHQRRQARLDRALQVKRKEKVVEKTRVNQQVTVGKSAAETPLPTQPVAKKAVIDEVADKKQAILTLLTKEKIEASDFEQVIMMLPMPHWVNANAESQPFFLALMGHEAIAEPWCSWLMRGYFEFKKTKIITPVIKFMKAVFSQMKWLEPYDKKDTVFSRLHWMVENNRRFIIFKNGIDLLNGSPLIGFNDKDAHLKLCAGYHSTIMGGVVPSVIAVIAIKHLDLLVQLYRAHASLSSVLTGLLTESIIDGQKMNAIHFFLLRRKESELDTLDTLLGMHDDRLHKEMLAFSLIKSPGCDFVDRRDLNWCLTMTFRREAEFALKLDEENSPLMQRSFFHRGSLVERFGVMMNNQKTFLQNIMLDEKSRDVFFECLVSFLGDAPGNPESKRLRDANLFDFNQMIPLEGRMVPLICCVFSSVHQFALLAWFEGDDEHRFYKEKLKAEHFTTPYYMPRYNAEIPMVYFLARGCSPKLSILSTNGFLSGKPAAYWLDPWKTNQSKGESILSALISQVSDLGKIALNELRALDQCVGGLLNEALLQVYNERYLGDFSPMTIPSAMPEARKPRTLYDVCFYLSCAVNGAMREFMQSDQGVSMIDSLPTELLFERVCIRTEERSLFFYAIQHKNIRQFMLLRFSGMQPIDRQFYLPGLCKALFKKNSNDAIENLHHWSAFIHLATTASGLDFLCDLMLTVDGLARELTINDFIYPDDTVFPANAAVDKMMEHQVSWTRFLNVIAKYNLTLYGQFLSLVTNATGQPIHALEKSPLQIAGLFSAPTASSPFDSNDYIVPKNG